MSMTTHTHAVYTYEPTRRTLSTDHGETHISYGITCFHSSPGGARHTVYTIPDIALSEDLVTAMAALFTLCQLPPDRFHTAVIDLLP